jgi:hypothetical protein
MWIVRLTEQRITYGPFDDPQEATRFRDFLTAEVDPAEAEELWSPLDALLNWRDHTNDAPPSRPSVRDGGDIGPEAEALYREEQHDRD